MRMRSLVLLCLLSVGCGPTTTTECPSDGSCASEVTASMTVAISQTEFLSSTIDACRVLSLASGSTEAVCSAKAPTSAPTGADEQTIVLTGDIPATARVRKTSDGYSVRVTFSLEGQSTGDTDTFRLELKRSDASSIKKLERMVTYTKLAPNGEACLPICKVGSFSE